MKHNVRYDPNDHQKSVSAKRWWTAHPGATSVCESFRREMLPLTQEDDAGGTVLAANGTRSMVSPPGKQRFI
ncbi:Homeobox-leucine zipper protein HDG11 [Frankliniella fusca]|uniref:Homeobox-leucine zipper protein HDG11 n=1 Tax=Frankliniella fusca TaxID=407009 RepID=A0AAE1GTJ1_9NEOP|nr:Homeobox-leucine zipper protein HDG11 [Frankliniella fusca]